MGLDQYATARKGEPITDDEGYTYRPKSNENFNKSQTFSY